MNIDFFLDAYIFITNTCFDVLQASMQTFKENLLYGMIEMKGNKAKRPDVFIKIIDD